MKVKFRTNLDNYQTNCFPVNLTIPPQRGDKVLVNISFRDYFLNKKLPIRLEVVDVIWSEHEVICELWYIEQDLKFAELKGVNLF